MKIKECPLCREAIKEGALKCKHCKSMLGGDEICGAEVNQEEYKSVKKAYKPIWKNWYVWVPLTIIVIGLIVAISGASLTGGSEEAMENIGEVEPKPSEIEEPEETETFSLDSPDNDLPGVVLVWQCQNQGVYSNTYLYGHDIENLVPTLLHPNEMLDGCVVSGNYVWPAFKVPTYLHVNHPILLELYRRHGKTLNFKGVVFSRSHNPTHWHKMRSANFCVKIARYLDAEGLVMAWEGGGNAAVDGMLTIQAAEKAGIKASTITFEFGGRDGTEGVLLVDDVPEADAVISGGSIEKQYTIPEVERVVGGDVLRLNKESGGYFPPADKTYTFDNTTQLYCSGNQAGHSRLFAEEY